jgi:hypothetical protein
MSPKEIAPAVGSAVAPLEVDAADVLDLEVIESESEDALVARGAAYAREYAAIEKKPTILAMNLAVVLLALRKKHDDMLGRSHDYRMQAQAVYSLANIPEDQRKRLQAAVRYHVGNMVRRHLTPREVRALGIQDATPLERQQDRRATDAALLRAVKVSADVAASSPRSSKTAKPAAGAQEVVPAQAGGSGLGVKATADHLRLASVAAKLVGELDVTVIDGHMTDGQRAKLDAELAALESAVRKLRRHLRTSRSGA